MSRLSAPAVLLRLIDPPTTPTGTGSRISPTSSSPSTL
jgi:hypothetical protein